MKKTIAGLSVLTVVLTTTACAHVNRDELGSELSQIRQEMAEGDSQVGQRLDARIDGVDARVDGVEGRVDLLEQDLGELESRFEVTVERLEAATRVNTPIYFTFNGDDVQEGDKELLDGFGAVVLTHFPEALITVEGFADPAGTREYNLQLGQRRAAAVRQYLIDHTGLPSQKVRAVSYGEDARRQVAPNQIRDAGWENRRVVLVIDHGANMQEGVVATVNDGNEGN